jgi:hypothetical protein
MFRSSSREIRTYSSVGPAHMPRAHRHPQWQRCCYRVWCFHLFSVDASSSFRRCYHRLQWVLRIVGGWHSYHGVEPGLILVHTLLFFLLPWCHWNVVRLFWVFFYPHREMLLEWCYNSTKTIDEQNMFFYFIEAFAWFGRELDML